MQPGADDGCGLVRILVGEVADQVHGDQARARARVALQRVDEELGGAEQADRTGDERQIIGQGRLAEQRLGDTGLQPLRHRDDFVGRFQRTGADQDGNLLAGVQYFGRSAQRFFDEWRIVVRMRRVDAVKTADGWGLVMCQTPKFWEALCDLAAAPELKADPRFADIPSRHANRPALSEAMDMRMPVMDGIEATRRLRTEWPTPQSQVPVLGLTANVHNADHDRCMAVGMSALVLKPFDRHALCGLIEEQLLRSPAFLQRFHRAED